MKYGRESGGEAVDPHLLVFLGIGWTDRGIQLGVILPWKSFMTGPMTLLEKND